MIVSAGGDHPDAPLPPDARRERRLRVGALLIVVATVATCAGLMAVVEAARRRGAYDGPGASVGASDAVQIAR